MNNKSYNLLSLLLNHLAGYFFALVTKKQPIHSPLHIGKYSFIKVIQHERGQDTLVAIYQDLKGNKAIAKIWQGKFKNYSYYSLKNEYLSYQSLHQIIARSKKYISKDLSVVKIPALIDYQEQDSLSVLLIEWVEGKVGVDISDQSLLKSYLLVSKYLDFLTEHATETELSVISKRSGLNYIFLYPITLIIAIIRHSEFTLDLLKGAMRVILAFPSFLKNTPLRLVHRDLNFENIMLTKSNIYLIDFQFLTLTYKAVELVNTLRYCYDKNRLKSEIQDAMMKNYADEYSIARLVAPLSIMHATHGLISTNFSKKVIGTIAKFLRSSL